MGNVELGDILKESPMEHEAETYILKAIEERAANYYSSNTNNSDKETTTPGPFPHIPDDAMSALSTKSDGEDNGEDEISTTSNNTSHLTPPPGLAASLNSPNTPNTFQSAPAAPQRRRLSSSMSTASPKPNTSTYHRRNYSNSTYRKHQHHHRRNLTMEQQLFGLASAIGAIQDDAVHDDAPFSDEMKLALSPNYNNAAIIDASASTLERNAGLLYHRATTKGGNKSNHRRGLLEQQRQQQPQQSTSTRRLLARNGSFGEEEPAAAGNGSVGSNKSSIASGSFASSRSYRNLLQYKKTDGDHGGGDNESITPESTGDNNSVIAAENQLADIEEGREWQSDANLIANDSSAFLAAPSSNNSNSSDDDNSKRSTTKEQANTMKVDDESIRPTAVTKSKTKNKKKNQNLRELQDFFEPKKTTIALYLRVVFLYIAAPLLGIAAIFFYLVDCPPTGRLQNGGHPLPLNNSTTSTMVLLNTNGNVVDPDQASIAWWLVFVVRQLVTFTLAKCSEIVFIDYLTIRSRGTMNLLGPWVTLYILQSRVSAL